VTEPRRYTSSESDTVLNPVGPASQQEELPLYEGEKMGDRLADVLFGTDEEQTATLMVPSQLIRTLAGHAPSVGWPCALTQEALDRLDPAGKHMLRELTRIFLPDGSEVVRTRMILKLADLPATQPWEEFVDLPVKAVGTMIDAARHGTIGVRPRGIPLDYVGFAKPVLKPTRPRWAGSVSFDPVIEQARIIASGMSLHMGFSDNAARQLLSMTEASILDSCHVVRVDPEQVAVLPEWENDDEFIEFGLEAELPFETIYLDFEGPGGLAPPAGIDLYGNPVTIRGALMFPRFEGGPLTVAPVGWAEGVEVNRQAIRWSPHETAGWFVFDRDVLRNENGKPMHITTGPLMLEGTTTGGHAILVAADSCCLPAEPDEDVPVGADGWPGHAILPFSKRAAVAAAGVDTAVNNIMWWSHLIWVLTKKAMAALSIVEAEEVILVDAPMERRDRKRAEKRGWPIAQQVMIRPARRRADGERTVTGNEANYSHRFWVRGHYKHFPLGTRVADVRPDLVRPCPRTDLATNCGFCRRIWTPPFIKGPDDKPLVLKTLVRRKLSPRPLSS
jgi:hypothetical protein